MTLSINLLNQVGLETSIGGSDFIFDCINLLHYKRYKIILKRFGSYIDSPKWIKNNKATANPINDDDKCHQFGATVAFSYEEVGKNSPKISKIKPFINQYNWKGINHTSKDDWKKFEKNNSTISLNPVFYGIFHVR